MTRNTLLVLLSLNLTPFLGRIMALACIPLLALPLTRPLVPLGVALPLIVLAITEFDLVPIKLRPTWLNIWPTPVVLLVNITILARLGPIPLPTIIHKTFSVPVLPVNLPKWLFGMAKNPTGCRLPNTSASSAPFSAPPRLPRVVVTKTVIRPVIPLATPKEHLTFLRSHCIIRLVGLVLQPTSTLFFDPLVPPSHSLYAPYLALASSSFEALS